MSLHSTSTPELPDSDSNTTNSGLLGMNLSVSPLCCQLMGWAGAGGGGAATVSVSFHILNGRLQFSVVLTSSFGQRHFLFHRWASYDSGRRSRVHSRQHVHICRLLFFRCVVSPKLSPQ